MTMPVVLGVDAGFTALGVVALQGNRIIACGTSRTERQAKKKGLRVADDDSERCRAQARYLLDMIREHEPAGAVIELPHGGAQGARANRAMGMATGVVTAVIEITGLAVEYVTPGDVKKAATSRKDAGKDEVEAAVLRSFEWGVSPPEVKSQREHVTDAAGALLAARGGTLMRMVEQMAKGA